MDNQIFTDPISITNALGVRGWAHLDAVLLASLAMQSPLLLVGPHGTAKSLLIERIAGALGLAMRHYNASLLNYDDLVGIPMPEEGNTKLRFIATPGAIWDAEFVFFDEISRCRPDLQNKMFPIVHERKIVGIHLHRLRHRWAAMNPPSPDDPDLQDTTKEYYLGAEALDPALADRFQFVVPVPNWREMDKEDRRRIVALTGSSGDRADSQDKLTGTQADTFPLNALVEQAAAYIVQLEAAYGEWLADYIVYVVDLLEQAKLPQSPRRARMLARSVIAVHAARMVLEGEDADLEGSAEMALIYSLPQSAGEVPPGRATIVAAHKQAWEIASLIEDDSWRQVLEEFDPARRILLANELNFSDDDLSRLITQAMSKTETEGKLVALATVLFLAYRQDHALSPAAWEPLARLTSNVLEPRMMNVSIPNSGTDMNIWREIQDWLKSRDPQDGTQAWIERNFVLSGFPDLWRTESWREALDYLRMTQTLFGLMEGS